MSSNIFLSTAPAYFAANIPVIPLFSQEKRPIPQGWNRFAEEMPGVEEQQAWLDQYPDGNIGLVLGKCSRVSVMDIDTDDQKLINMILKELPESPWVRVGKKGMVIAFRYNGVKTFRIKTADGKSVCEYLSDRTQVVLPPSIHPDTKRPYTANCELLDVYEKLPRTWKSVCGPAWKKRV
jgi:putative DNA primase/helicase